VLLIESRIPNPALNKTYKTMEAQINQTQEEIQVYKNDFLSGIVMLTKKLFML